jgi:pectate lyase
VGLKKSAALLALTALLAIAPAAAATAATGRTTTAPAWAANRGYATGTVVTHNGRRWQATAASAGWAPGAVGEVGPAQGFAQGTTGGGSGRQVWVTTLADSGPGSLRAAVTAPGAAWIRFQVSGTIRLLTALSISSDKTVDGRGARVTLTGRGLRVDNQRNVILTGLTLRGHATSPSDEDAILVWRTAGRVWLDHLDIAGWPDEAIDISQGATDVTLSWLRIHGQDKAVLIGSWGDNTSTSNLQRVTIHHTWFDHTGQRNPRAVRYSQVHVYNNYLHGWTGVGMSAANWAQLASESNVIRAETRTNAITTQPSQSTDSRAPAEGYARSTADQLLNRASVLGVRRPELVFNPGATYQVAVTAAGTALQNDITTYSGVTPVVPREGAWRLLP